MSLDIVGGGQVRVAGAVGGGEDGEHVHTELRGEQAWSAASITMGILLWNNAALPLISSTANLWNRWRVFSSCPVCLVRAAPKFLICFSACSCQPPSVSTGRGMKAIPALLHASPCLVIFSFKREARAWPGWTAAWLTNPVCRGLTTVMSRAVFLPLVQLGIRTSAGLAFDPGIRALYSVHPVKNKVRVQLLSHVRVLLFY